MLSFEEIRKGIDFICGNEINNLCRLCFTSIEATTDSVCLEDIVTLSGMDNDISFLSIFKALGIPSDSLPQTLCQTCAMSVVNNYIFHKQCQLSTEKWNQIVNTLNENLIHSKIRPHVETIYFMINKSENKMFTTYVKCKERNKKIALAKLRGILKRHKSSEKKMSAFNISCRQCGQSFYNQNTLIEHVKDHNKSHHTCNKCSKRFSNAFLLKQHHERLHSPKILQCDKCAKKFSTKRQLRLHERYYHVPVPCKLCDVTFNSRLDLRTHQNHHEIHKCDTCEKKFTNTNTFRRHVKLCNKDTLKFICDICNKVYSQKSSLKSHLTTDHGFGVVLSCEWCDKKFDAQSKLKSHILKHTKEKNFVCVQCGGKFVSGPALVYHTRIHTGEKPYACDICGERFLSASRRMTHKRWKHFEPTKECHVCNAKFVSKNDLKRHFKRHLNPQSRLYTPIIVEE